MTSLPPSTQTSTEFATANPPLTPESGGDHGYPGTQADYLTGNDRFTNLTRDPSTNGAARINTNLLSQNRTPVLIIGAGFGGLLFAIRLIQSGTYTAVEIILVDTAGGFGETWYWNRYPGIMCDVESFIYLPLLDETGYMPSMKKGVVSDEEGKSWTACAEREKSKAGTSSITLEADIVMLASGPFSGRQAPEFPNLERYQGDISCTPRWNYDISGGSTESPELDKLKDKAVGIVETGASTMQVVPQLAASAKELIVFQRTPSSVDWRNDYPIDTESWKEASRKAGWQRCRMENFNSFSQTRIRCRLRILSGTRGQPCPSSAC
ncbi:hypothetical protein BJX65DRAFT_307296 [Aspergillus insuetus]